MKRSNQPFFWMLFGAGGTLSALIGAMLVFLTGVASPAGWVAPGLLGYGNALAFARSLAGQLFLFLVVSLFLWHAAHRIFHSLHDLGVHGGWGAKLGTYGVALLGTLAAAAILLTM